MRDSSISKMLLRLNSSDNVTIKDFTEFYQLYESISPEERQKERENSAKLLFYILKNINLKVIDEDIKRNLINVVEQIAVTTGIASESYIPCGEYIFINFLNELRQKKTDNINELVKIYEELSSDLDRVDWVFSIQNEIDVPIFSLNLLMRNIVDNFKFDTENLISLSLLLRLYIKTDSINGDISTKVEELIKTHNLKCLDYIKQNGRQLLPALDVKSNQTMVFKINKKVLIRHPDREYFQNIKEDEIGYETDKEGRRIACFYEYVLDDDKTMSFVEFCNEVDSDKNKLEFIIKILKDGSFNIFYEEAIVISENQTYTLLNRFGTVDKNIVYQNQNYPNDFSNFLKVINVDNISVRQSIIYRRNKFDILTLDFICKFLSLFTAASDRTKFLELKINFPEEEFLQNIYCKEFLNFYCTDCRYPLEVLEKYVDFFYDNITGYSMSTEMSELKSLVMPYKIYLPKNFMDKEFLYQMYFDDIAAGNKLSVVEFSMSNDEYGDTNIIVKGQSAEGIYDLEHEKVEVKIGEKHLGFFDSSTNKLYYDREIARVTSKFINICKYIQSMKNSYEVMQKINWSDVEKVIEIIQSIKLLPINFTTFSVAPHTPNRLTQSIFWYKILWHFNLWHWGKEKVEEFLRLVLQKHFIDPAINYRSIVNEWCNKISDLVKDRSNLVFQKENNIGTTLHAYIEELSLSRGGKQVIENTILDTRFIEVSNKRLIYNENQIKKIIILVDNIMGGTSLSGALDYYFGYNEAKDDKGRYFSTDTNIRGENFKKLQIPIEVRPIWSSAEVINKFKQFKFKSNEEEEINVKIIPEKIIDTQFKTDEEVQIISNKLYGPKSKKKYQIPDVLLLRFNNMPSKYIFPENVADTKLLVGLFNRSEEYNAILK